MRFSPTIVALAALGYTSFFAVASPVETADGIGAPHGLKQRESRSLTGCLTSTVGVKPVLPLPARFKLFAQECFFDVVTAECKITSVPSHPVTYYGSKYPLPRVEIPSKPTSSFPTFSLAEGRLVLHDDKVNGQLKPDTDYYLAHTPPASKVGTQKTTGAYFGYTAEETRPGEQFPLFDVIWLPNCAGVALKQRDLAPSTFLLSGTSSTVGPVGFILAAVSRPVVPSQLYFNSKNAYVVVHNEDGTLYDPLL